ncbi:MAG: hypothetical protein U9Q40_10845 [Campylobacterota bacterium]|nr:hypothetical protein [Campylobacterota bacterium]
MKKIYTTIVTAIAALALVGCSATEAQPFKADTPQSVQIMSTQNSDGKVTTKTIEKAFDAAGLTVGANNDMNNPFGKRFPSLHYKVYNLAVFSSTDLTFKLIKKYPQFGALMPLTMSIWSDKDTMNVATLTLDGLARTAGIPKDDADLIAYAAMITKALNDSMPNGALKELNHNVKDTKSSYAVDFVAEIDMEEVEDIEEYKEDFQAEFEGEMEPIGFLFPNFMNLKEEIFDDAGYDVYDFYDTYSICKFDVIYPVSKATPEAGAYAPCSFYMYKKKGEDKMHLGFLGVDNWIETLDIQDEHSMKQLRDAQQMIEDIVNELTE